MDTQAEVDVKESTENADIAVVSTSDAHVALMEKYDIHVYRPSSYRFDPRTIVLPDDFFATTLSDVREANRSHTTRVSGMNDAPLMTKKMRAAEEAAKMARFKKVLIRVLMPDRYSLQGVFTPKSTVKDVHDFVRNCLREDGVDNVKFHLFVVPPKMVLKDMRRTLWDEKLVPAAQVMLGIDEGPTATSQLLKEDIFTLCEDPPAPVPQQPAVPSADAKKTTGKTTGTAPKPSTKSKSKTVPKWFKRK